MRQKRNKNPNYVAILLIAFSSSLFVDFVSFNSVISNITSIIFLVFFLVFSLINWEKSINLLLGYLFLIPEYPRSVLDIIDHQLDGGVTYNNLYSVGFGPVNGFLIALFLWILAGFLQKKKIKFSKDLLHITILFILINMIGLAFNIEELNIEERNNPLYLLKPFIFMLISSSIGFIKSLREIFTLGLNISLILGIRAIFFLFYDLLIFEIPKLDLGLSPYFSFGIFLYALLKKEKLSPVKWILLTFSLLYPSRSFILFIILISLFFFIQEEGILKTFKFALKSLLILPLLGIILFMLNPRLFEFFLWKLEIIQVFTKNYSVGSGSIRWLEFKNIIYQNTTSILKFVFGGGPYGTYDFDAYPLIVEGVIDSKSFSPDQLLKKEFYTTHNVISALLLKTGITGLIVYSTVFLKIYHRKLSLRTILALPLFYTTYSSFLSAILSGILFRSKE